MGDDCIELRAQQTAAEFGEHVGIATGDPLRGAGSIGLGAAQARGHKLTLDGKG